MGGLIDEKTAKNSLNIAKNLRIGDEVLMLYGCYDFGTLDYRPTWRKLVSLSECKSRDSYIHDTCKVCPGRMLFEDDGGHDCYGFSFYFPFLDARGTCYRKILEIFDDLFEEI